IQLYKEYGFYKEDLFSLSKKGRSGNEEINAIMCRFRSNPPHILGGSPVLEIKDYLEGYQNLPPSDVLQFFTEDGSKITVRPSGTEPKIKFYIGVKAAWRENYSLEQQQKELDVKIESLKKDMKIG
ncbi:MAG: phospho-sugar mutase, partial [Bacteroidales bacterium]